MKVSLKKLVSPNYP